MYFQTKMQHSPMGSAWNLFSSAAFEGSSDPGIPKSEDGDNDLPPIESSDASENLSEMSSIEGVDQEIGNSSGIVDPARTRGVDPARTK